jgi:hypothetical protein
MDFWVEFFNNLNEKVIINHDFHGFKWQNISIYPILTIFLVVGRSFWLVGL